MSWQKATNTVVVRLTDTELKDLMLNGQKQSPFEVSKSDAIRYAIEALKYVTSKNIDFRSL